MTAYSATFSDGKSISLKNSKREYAAAWRVIATFSNRIVGDSGFARDADLAHKAARSAAAGWGKVWDDRKRKLVAGPDIPTLAIEVVAVVVEGSRK